MKYIIESRKAMMFEKIALATGTNSILLNILDIKFSNDIKIIVV